MSIEICPNCEAGLAATVDSVLRCEQCKWKADSGGVEGGGNVFQNIYSSLSRKFGDRLFDSLVNSSSAELKPALTFGRGLAFALSAFIFLITFLLPVFSAWLLIIGWGNIVTLILGIAGLLATWAIRPRIPGVPKGVLPREDFPSIYAFVDAIAASLGAKRVDGIIIDGDINASFIQYGLGNRKIIGIGLPLWEILSARERAALVAHELAHGINGDPLRGLFIGNAFDSLRNWYLILRPESFWEPGSGLAGILSAPLNIFLWILSVFVLLLAYLLAYLIYADSQRAEYYADYLATKVCGTDAMIGMLEKLLIGNKRFETILHRVSLRKDAGDLFAEFSQDVFSLSTKEKERIKKIGQLEKSRLDATHPPIFFRMQFLKNHYEAGTQISPEVVKNELLEKELSKIRATAQAEMISNYEAGLYY